MSPYTVRQFLDAALDPRRRVAALQDLAGRFVGAPLDATVCDLRAALLRATVEDYQRLSILISHLRPCGADSEQIAALHAELDAARTQRTTHA